MDFSGQTLCPTCLEPPAFLTHSMRQSLRVSNSVIYVPSERFGAVRIDSERAKKEDDDMQNENDTWASAALRRLVRRAARRAAVAMAAAKLLGLVE